MQGSPTGMRHRRPEAAGTPSGHLLAAASERRETVGTRPAIMPPTVASRPSK